MSAPSVRVLLLWGLLVSIAVSLVLLIHALDANEFPARYSLANGSSPMRGMPLLKVRSARLASNIATALLLQAAAIAIYRATACKRADYVKRRCKAAIAVSLLS